MLSHYWVPRYIQFHLDWTNGAWWTVIWIWFQVAAWVWDVHVHVYICRTISVQNKGIPTNFKNGTLPKILNSSNLNYTELVVPFAVLQKVNQISLKTGLLWQQPDFCLSSNFRVPFLKPVGPNPLAEAVSQYAFPPLNMDDSTAHHHIVFIPLWTEACSWTL